MKRLSLNLRAARLANAALASMLGMVVATDAFAQAATIQVRPGQTLGAVAGSFTDSLTGVSVAIAATCYVCAVVMAAVAIFKFKAYSDQPERTPIKQPILYLVVAVMLAAIPEVLGTGIMTTFGGAAETVPSL